jgi:hypothetical protein
VDLRDCITGVADEEPLDRVGQVDLIGLESAARGPVSPSQCIGFLGAYTVTGPEASAGAVLSVALSDRCDLVLATATTGSSPCSQEVDRPQRPPFLRWAETTLRL